MHRWLRFACVASSLAFSAGAEPSATAPQSSKDVTELSLEDLLNTPTAVASQKAETIRETPGVVTVFSRDEIVSTGARDLTDILMLVPGFSPPAVDVEGVIDMGFRGIWGHEGKVLLMVDGEPMNELLYDDNALGQHFPADLIQSVEVIRGPGSALYGGWAELAVVNVVTRGAADLHGLMASVFYSQYLPGRDPSALGRRTVSLAYGQQDLLGVRGLDVSLQGSIGQGNLSTGTFSDFAGNSYGMSASAANGGTNSEQDPLFLNLGVRYRDLKVRFLIDNFRFNERDSYGTDNGAATGRAANQKFYSLFADASYDFRVGKLTVTPRLTYKYQIPWQAKDPTVAEYLDASAARYTARLTANYDFTEELRAMIGTEDYIDHAWNNNLATQAIAVVQNTFPNPNDPNSITYSNVAVFGEAEYRSPIGNLTLGARYERHSAFGDSFVPRAALTKVLGKFHFKALYSFAFRAPGIEDISLSAPSQPVRPERTRVAEAEVGYQFTDNLFASANLFDITLQDPIVYSYDQATSVQAYLNFPRTGSEGFEIDTRARYGWGFVNANYSFYTAYSIFAAAAKNEVPLYDVPGTNTQLLAMPAHKLVLYAKLNVSKNVSFNPSGVFFSERSGVTGVDAGGNSVIASVPAVGLVNVFVTVDNVVIPGLQVSAGAYNLFDAQWSYLQAYNSGHAPLPAPGRELALHLSYNPAF